MASQINFKEFVEKFAVSALKSNLSKYEKAGKQAAKQIRENIVNDWFGEFNSSSVNEATQYVAYSRLFDNFTGKVYITSYVDIDAYKDKPSARRWIQRHPIVGNIKDPKEYVLMLQMKDGIIGLPAHSTFAPNFTQGTNGYMHWINGVNQHFHQRPTGLEEETYNSELWQNFNDMIDNLVK